MQTDLTNVFGEQGLFCIFMCDSILSAEIFFLSNYFHFFTLGELIWKSILMIFSRVSVAWRATKGSTITTCIGTEPHGCNYFFEGKVFVNHRDKYVVVKN